MNIEQIQALKSGVTHIEESSDLRESLQELNLDRVDDDGFTSIDTRTNLTLSQVPALACLDNLCYGGVLPKEFNRIGRSVKRLSVSIKKGGRNDMVAVVNGVNEQKKVEGSVSQRVRGDV